MAKTHKNIVYFAFSLIYGFITSVRNWLFDIKILKSRSFELPIISVGNLTVGGTGKTPHVEFLLKNLSSEWKSAVLSRGYKRKTKGFQVALMSDNAESVGDEPWQIFSKFAPRVIVAVDEKRVRGVEQIIGLKQGVELIILDDAYQHRYIKPGLSILLTDFHNLYFNDFMLPYGTLREKRRNSKRADIIIVSKCNEEELEKTDIEKLKRKLKLKVGQTLFFSTFQYGNPFKAFGNKEEKIENLQDKNILLFTGIEKPKDLSNYLSDRSKSVKSISFPDHYHFTEKDYDEIEKQFLQLPEPRIMLTSEKDFARLQSNRELSSVFLEHLFIIPIEVKILNNKEKLFIQKIEDYVRENSTNS